MPGVAAAEPVYRNATWVTVPGTAVEVRRDGAFFSRAEVI
jgi:hypothetical protein